MQRPYVWAGPPGEMRFDGGVFERKALRPYVAVLGVPARRAVGLTGFRLEAYKK